MVSRYYDIPMTHAVFYFGSKDPTALSGTLSQAAAQFQYWCQLNRLTLNLDKTMLFTTLSKKRKQEFIRILELDLGRIEDAIRSLKQTEESCHW